MISANMVSDGYVAGCVARGSLSLDDRPAALRSARVADVWRNLSKERRRALAAFKRYIPDNYIEGVARMPFDQACVPSLSELNRALEPSGWAAAWNAGLTDEEFFQLTSRKIFPVALHCRELSETGKSRLPDVIHDVWGHLPMLHVAPLSDMITSSSKLYVASRYSATDQEIDRRLANGEEPDDLAIAYAGCDVGLRKMAARYFLFTVEFGVMSTGDRMVAFGGGILSSTSELEHLASGAPIRPLSVEALASNEFRPFGAQPRYYRVASYDEAMAVLSDISQEVEA